MGTAAIIGSAISLGASAVGAVKQHKAGGEAEKLADANAKNTEAETAEQIKRVKADQQQTLDTSKAIQASSGVSAGGGSFGVYMDEMQKTFDSDVAWMEKSGASQASLQRAEGRVARNTSRANAWGTVASGASSLMTFWK